MIRVHVEPRLIHLESGAVQWRCECVDVTGFRSGCKVPGPATREEAVAFAARLCGVPAERVEVRKWLGEATP